ncbi:hypothetical protein AWH69_07495 [Janibacter melonis]|uniref:Uncharacterized protein n=1 Tax=Janibacter melonis TaxID=262209 RepID=A0A176QDU4_9MICO|nr:DUF2017 domain-containing protein [Janibacter melonis]MBD5831456.1 DUF2017 domain-containing protein [Janibacter melonis]OAB87865.1 hypothetical protein AWH69_07495 [Janibacter melonis]
MARAFQRRGEDVVAWLDADEREVLAQLAEQVLDVVSPQDDGPVTAGEGEVDPFDAIVAGLGTLSTDTGTPDPERSAGLDEERDPALDRLFPAGHRGDPEEAREFRRLTEGGLRQRKAGNLRTLAQAVLRPSADPGDPEAVVLDRGEAVAVLVALTDIRLVMGERLGLRTDDDADRLERVVADLDDEDPAAFALMLYDFLTWLQESLGRTLPAGPPRGGAGGAGGAA